MAVSKVDAANQIENQLPQANIAGNVNFRNIIINGDMSIAQRATEVTGITSTSYNTVDRFRTVLGTAGTWTQSQSTDVPSSQGFAKSLKMDCTVANTSLSADSILTVRQNFEGQNLQYLKKGTSSAESLTLSFWVKSNKTGTYIANIYDGDNSRQISKSYTINTADTWEKKTITFAGDTTGTLDNDNNSSLLVDFFLVAGSTYSSGTLATSWESYSSVNQAVGNVNLADSTDNEWLITGVQLEAASAPSDFEFLPHDVNLQRCQRYYEEIYFAFKVPTEGVTNLASAIGGMGYFNVKKRAAPTVSRTSSTTENIDTLSNNGYTNGIEFNGRVTSGTRSRWIGTATADAEL